MILKKLALFVAIIGLVCICLFGGYLLGLRSPKTGFFPEKVLSSQEKALVVFSENLTNQKNQGQQKATPAEAGVAPLVEAQQKPVPQPTAESGQPQGASQHSLHKRAAPLEDNTQQTPMAEQEAVQKKDAEATSSEPDKEDKSPAVAIDPLTLGQKLFHLYRSQPADTPEQKTLTDREKNALRQFLFQASRPRDAREKMLDVWDQRGQKVHRADEWRNAHYTALDQMEAKFDIDAIKEKFQLNQDDKEKPYAQAMKRIIVKPWYSRAYY